MPFSTDKSIPWVQVSMSEIEKYLPRLQAAASKENALAPWIEKKFGRDESQTSFIIAQFQNDESIFSMSVQEFIKHPNAIFMQFRSDNLDKTDMWRWVPDPLAKSDLAEGKFEAFSRGRLLELDEKGKLDALQKLKAKIVILVGAHGAAVTGKNAAKMPVESAGGFSAMDIAMKLEKVLQYVPQDAVEHLYARFLVCNIVMPQEKAKDPNGYIGTFVKHVHATYPGFQRVEASGSPFPLTYSSASTHTLRRVRHRFDSYLTADDLERLGWGRKFRVEMTSSDELTESGSGVRLTEFERNLAIQWREGQFPDLLNMLSGVESLLAEPGLSTADQRIADEKHWQPLKFVLRAMPDADTHGKRLWEDAQQIEVIGESADLVRVRLPDIGYVPIRNLARDLQLFKLKMLHFPPMPGANETESTQLGTKRAVQLWLRHFDLIEKSFALLDWPHADGSQFSCLAQLADYRTDHLNVMLLGKDPVLEGIAKDAMLKGGKIPPTTQIAVLSVRVMHRARTKQPDRDLASKLTTLRPDALAKALVFEVRITSPGGKSIKKETHFSADTTQKLLQQIDAKVSGATEQRKILTRINSARIAGLRSALQDPQAGPASQDDAQVARAAEGAHSQAARTPVSQ